MQLCHHVCRVCTVYMFLCAAQVSTAAHTGPLKYMFMRKLCAGSADIRICRRVYLLMGVVLFWRDGGPLYIFCGGRIMCACVCDVTLSAKPSNRGVYSGNRELLLRCAMLMVVASSSSTSSDAFLWRLVLSPLHIVERFIGRHIYTFRLQEGNCATSGD